MKKVPLTANGAEQLRRELHRLKTVERPQVIKAIAEARAHGDLRENAEYHAAKERQGFIEGRIAEIESKLAHAHVIDINDLPADGRVVFGVTVVLEDTGSGTEVMYKIVGEDEADIQAGMISVNAPIARALIGRLEGEDVRVETPSGAREYTIIQVRYE